MGKGSTPIGVMNRPNPIDRIEQGERCCIPSCEEPRRSDAPQPLCTRHLIEAFRYIRDALRDGQHLDEDRTKARIAGTVKRIERETRAVVYYVRIGDCIKIGYSTDLSSRIATFRAHNNEVELLAVEGGGPRVEKLRHRQFGSHRIPRTELFRPHRELDEHISALQKT